MSTTTTGAAATRAAGPTVTPVTPVTAVTGVGLAIPGVRTPRELLAVGPDGAAAVDPAAKLGKKKGLRYKDRATQLALCCADEALRDAGLLGDDGLTVPGESVAVVIASNYGNVDTVCAIVDMIAAEGTAGGLSPMDTPNASSNVIASTLAVKYGLRGPNLMLCNGPTSGLDAVRWAATLIRSRRADRALVLGVEPDNEAVRRLAGTDRLVDGAAAVVVERLGLGPARGVVELALIGGTARTAGVRACLDRLGTDAPAVWFGPGDGKDPADGTPLPGVPRYDLAGTWGESSAALGVLQCAGAVGWFAAGGAGPVYAVAGRDGDDATAGVVLRAPDAVR